MKFIIGAGGLAIAVLVFLFVASGHTALTLSPHGGVIGDSNAFTLQAVNPHGIRRVSVYLEQNGAKSPLLDQSFPAKRFFWPRHEEPRSFSFVAGRAKDPNLKEGKARIVAETASNDFGASTDTTSIDVDVVLTPPHVVADGAQHYVNQGGMELVTFTPTGNFSESGVRVGKYAFRSFALPDHPGERFAMFAYPWDLPPDITPVVYARNAAGTEATAHFWFKLFPKKFRERDFPVDDALLEKLVNSVDSTGKIAPGPDIVTRFLKINGDLRRQNNAQLADLRLKTEEKILWNGPFIHYGKEEADFADVRDYTYHGKRIDKQVHLGFDLSDTSNSPVNAANDGKVVWASDLGIYGNCIVLDHGYSLQSIYGHMREIDVKVGDSVKKGQKMGIAGSTGLAGGVHVHFSMQIDGVQINPREWWDPHWIKDRILSKLAPGAVIPEESAAAAVPHSAKPKGKHGRRR